MSKEQEKNYNLEALSEEVLEEIAKYAESQEINYSIETGVGLNTLFFLFISKNHQVFTEWGNSGNITSEDLEPLLTEAKVEFIEGATSQTLPQHKFTHKLQLAFIDSQYGYPVPELEYYYIYPHLEKDALLVINNIHIPNIYNLFKFLTEETMFKLLTVVENTALFKRTEAPLFDSLSGKWWQQQYNKQRFPIKLAESEGSLNIAENQDISAKPSSYIDVNYYVNNHSSDQDSRDYNKIHTLRFQRTYDWVKKNLQDNIKILELGGEGLFSYIIKDRHPSVEITNITSDLRYEFDLPSDYFDLILNMETIEHIKDRDPDRTNLYDLSLFSMTGINSFLSECHRVLKPEGLMFLSTPNINSLENIHRILNYMAPLNYYPHFREYSINELVNWTEKQGFKVLQLATTDNFGDYIPGCRSAIKSLLLEKGISTEYRGDTIFMDVQKVANI